MDTAMKFDKTEVTGKTDGWVNYRFNYKVTAPPPRREFDELYRTTKERNHYFTEGYSLIPRILRRLSERAYNIQRRFHGDKSYTFFGNQNTKWLKKQAEERERRETEERLRRELQSRLDAQTYQKEVKARQDKCTHRKGGRYAKHLVFGTPDFALTMHQFIDGSFRVWCQICRKEFDPKAPETIEMMQQTTNTVTASEQVLFAFSNGMSYTVKQMMSILKSPAIRFKKLLLENSGLFSDKNDQEMNRDESVSTMSGSKDAIRPYDDWSNVSTIATFQDKIPAPKKRARKKKK
jgi:hypothetical protein